MNYSEFCEETSFETNTTINNHVWGDQIIKQEEKERKEREKKRYEEYTMKIKKQREEQLEKQKILKELKEKEFIEFHGTDMWQPGEDYPNIFVPLSVKRIPALDKANFLELWLGRDGDFNIVSSLLGVRDLEPYTIEEYYKEFCTEKKEDKETKYIFTKKVDWNYGSVNYGK